MEVYICNDCAIEDHCTVGRQAKLDPDGVIAVGDDIVPQQVLRRYDEGLTADGNTEELILSIRRRKDQAEQ